MPANISELLPREALSELPTQLKDHAADESSVRDAYHSIFTSESPALARYGFYLRHCWSTFELISASFPRANPGREEQKDSLGIGTTSLEMLALANQLYIARSFGVEGCLLECGCFKGFSACCLSHACSALGVPLVMADSFAGLPEIAGEAGVGVYYQAGDFAGAFEEVQSNLASFGRHEVVSFCHGFYSESLQGWNQPIALLWMDVDLPASARDVLTATRGSLSRGAAVFSHDFEPTDIAEGKIRREDWLAAEVRDHLLFVDEGYESTFVGACTAAFTFAQTPGREAPRWTALLEDVLRELSQGEPQLS